MLTPQSSGYMPPRQPNTGGRIGYWRGALAGIAPAGPFPQEVGKYPFALVIQPLDLREEPRLASTVTVPKDKLDPVPLYPILAFSYEYSADQFPATIGGVQHTWLLLGDPATKAPIGWICAATRVRVAEGKDGDGVQIAPYVVPVEGIDDPFVEKLSKLQADLVAATAAIDKFVASRAGMKNPLPDAVHYTPPSDSPAVSVPIGANDAYYMGRGKDTKDDAATKAKTKQASSTPLLLVAGVALVALLMSKKGGAK